ncbi:MAG: DUF2232 domain-containing protein [Cyanobacteria bacterium RI_101]|nr:DUF2232 domain-containing protein [Cyanobacteria bacterium RI_101]
MTFAPPDSAPEPDSNWVDDSEGGEAPLPQPPAPRMARPETLAMVESAFFASAASLIWLINYYFPLGPLLRIFFPLPLALIYLRWGARTTWKGVIAAGLLLSVLMGPTRSIVFVIPFGLISLQLGFCWRRRAPWEFSILTGALIGAFGFFFRFWLFSILLGENLWRYVIAQVTGLLDWLFLRLNILAQPDPALVQGGAVVAVLFNSLIYLFAVHLAALLVFDRIGNPIPRPPRWLKVILDYE